MTLLREASIVSSTETTTPTTRTIATSSKSKQTRFAATSHRDEERKPPHKNKSWKRDADKGTSSSKKELAAFVRQQARKELHAFATKRKVSSNEDDKSVGSLNGMEDGEIDLSAFNYSEMDNLKIDSDDDTVQNANDKSDVSV